MSTTLDWKRLLSLIGLVIVTVFWCFGSTDAPAEIVGVWLFDAGTGDVVEDASGNGHAGKLLEGAQWVDGKFGKALSCERAKKQYVQILHAESLNLTTFSILAWVKVEKPIEWQGILAKQAGTTGPNYGLWINPDGMLHSDVGGPTINGKTNVTDGKWHHVGVTSDGEKLRLYFDGTLDAEGTGGIGKPNAEPLTIGRPSTTSPSVLEGLLDEVILTDIPLTIAEIQEFMTSGFATKPTAIEASGKLAIIWAQIK